MAQLLNPNCFVAILHKLSLAGASGNGWFFAPFILVG